MKALTIPIICFIHPQFSKIYRCWVIWGHSIRVIIIPFVLALAFLGQSIYLSHSLVDLIYALSYLVGNVWHILYCTKWDRPANQYSGCGTYSFGA